jgi:hypothetical protein
MKIFELQHHRMIDDFVSIGLQADDFYCERDVTTFPSAREEVSHMKRDDDPLENPAEDRS